MANPGPAQAPLGEGMARDAARRLRARKFQLQDAENAAEGMKEEGQEAIPEAGGKGFFKPRSSSEKAMRQKQLEQMLKNRGR